MALSFKRPTPGAPATPPSPAVRAPRTPRSAVPSAGGPLPRKEEGEGSGAYMRRLLRAGYNDTNAILEAVHAQYPGSKAGPSDVSYNKNKLKKEDGDPAAGPVTLPKTKREKGMVNGSPPKYAAPPSDVPFDGGVPYGHGAKVAERSAKHQIADSLDLGALQIAVSDLERRATDGDRKAAKALADFARDMMTAAKLLMTK